MAIINNTIINGKLYVNGNINASVVTAGSFVGALTGTASNATKAYGKEESALSVSYATTAGSATSAGSATRATSATYASRIVTTANSANTAYYIPFTAASTSDTDGASLLVGNSKAFTFNPSTGLVVATKFSGSFSGNATSAGYAGKITTAVKTDNVNYYIPFVSGSAAATSTAVYVGSSQAFTFNASTGVVRATKFSVAGSANLQYNSTSDCLEVVFL